MDKTTTIYALVDPRDGTHHYIGKTVQEPPRKRLHQHLRKPASDDLAAWFDGLRALELQPEFRVLESVPPDADWRAAEIYWIRHGLEHGWCLKNHAIGGDNYPIALLEEADDYDIIPRIVYADENTMRLLTAINAYVMRGKSAEDETFRDLYQRALVLVDAEGGAEFTDRYEALCQHLLTHGIIQITRGWRVPVMKKHNRIGGEFLAVGKPFTINGIGIPGKWDQGGWRTTIKMRKVSSELLDTLATAACNGRRRGYASVLRRALELLSKAFDEVVAM